MKRLCCSKPRKEDKQGQMEECRHQSQSHLSSRYPLSQKLVDQYKQIDQDIYKHKQKLENEKIDEINNLKYRNVQLDEQLFQRDHLISQLQSKLDENKSQLDYRQELLQSVKQKEGFYEKNQDELRELIIQLNTQLLDGEREFSIIRQRLQASEQHIDQMKLKEVQDSKQLLTREDEFIQLLHQERQRNQDLTNELDYFSKEVNYKEDNQRKLEESQRTLNRIIEDQQKRIDEEKIILSDQKEQLKVTNERLSESMRGVLNIEQRYCKMKAKYETEIQMLKEDKLKYLKKYKAKINDMKPSLKTNEDQISQLRLENVKVKSEYENVNQIARHLENQIQSYQQEIPSIEQQKYIQQLLMLSYSYQNELERLSKLNNQLSEAYQNRSEEFTLSSYQLQQAIEHLEKLTQQYEKTQQEYERLLFTHEKTKDELKNCQHMLEKVCEMGHTQMDDLDSKVSRFNVQLQQAQADKKSLLKENTQLKQDAQHVEMNEQILEKHIQKQKKENKYLQRQLGEVNTNLKDIIVEKHSEMKNNSKLLSQNMSYISMKNKMDLLSSNSKRDFLRIEEDSMQDM